MNWILFLQLRVSPPRKNPMRNPTATAGIESVRDMNKRRTKDCDKTPIMCCILADCAHLSKG